MKVPFNIKKGVYVVPELGRFDCNKPLTNDQQVELYLNSHFKPFITLNEAGVALLKKAKATKKQVAALIVKANTTDEVELLLKVHTDKTLEGIAEQKRKSLIS